MKWDFYCNCIWLDIWILKKKQLEISYHFGSVPLSWKSPQWSSQIRTQKFICNQWREQRRQSQIVWEVHGNRTSINKIQVESGEILIKFKGREIIRKIIKHWNSSPKHMEYKSLKMLKTQLDMALGQAHMVEATLNTELYNLRKHSVI